jgi:hypothetical protein
METSGRKKEEITGDWRTLHKQELHDFYSTANKTLVNKSREIASAEEVALIGRRETQRRHRKRSTSICD